ncbi:MAG: pilus (MSHA type) biogenesis protein MshL [Gammaproteobacteria bacterium]|nr:pilus (MSHA type) biogenesis protein MshL [Gammaproteobacteria bacterium]
MKLSASALGLILSLFLLSSCAVPPPRGDSVSTEINQTLTESQQQSKSLPAPVPAAVAAALTPPLTIELGPKDSKPVERRFDITVKSAPAESFFMGLVKDTPYNMVVPPGLKGKITLSMKNVTIDEVMEAVRDIYGYEYRKTLIGYAVMATTMQSRIFKIDYLDVQRTGMSQVRVSSGQVTAKSKSNSGTNGSSQEPDGISGSEVNTRSNSDFWADLRAALNAIVGTDDGRKVIINPQSGILIVRALPRELREVESYLKDTQTIIQRQVILEAKIIEVTLNDGYQTGVNWSLLAHAGDQSVVAGQFGGGSIFSTGASNLKGQINALDPTNASGIRSDVATAFGGMFAMSLNLGDFTGFLEFLKTQGNVHVLSSPRVSTVNNQKAVIKVGTDEFFVTDINTESTTLAGSASTDHNVDVELTPFFSGVALDVIPEISADDDVTLHIHPSVSEVSEKIKEININNTNNLSLPLAQSTIRESDSIVRARNGQIVVIGGLMQNQTQDKVASVPLLGDVPLVGELFRHRQQVTRKTELVILLKPIVITGNQDWTSSITNATGRFDHLQSAVSEGNAKP